MTKPEDILIPNIEDVIPEDPVDKFISEEDIETIVEEEKTKEEFKIRVSFECFEDDIEAFNLGGADGGWFKYFLNELKGLTSITKKQLFGSLRRYYQPHKHDWDKLQYDFEDINFYKQNEGMQIQFEKSKGRVHGFFYNNVFYIIWLDPHHNLYPIDKHGGFKKYARPQTPYEKLELDNYKLNRDMENLESELEECYELLEEKLDSCIFCTNEENIMDYKNKYICLDCINSLKAVKIFKSINNNV